MWSHWKLRIYWALTGMKWWDTNHGGRRSPRVTFFGESSTINSFSVMLRVRIRSNTRVISLGRMNLLIEGYNSFLFFVRFSFLPVFGIIRWNMFYRLRWLKILLKTINCLIVCKVNCLGLTCYIIAVSNSVWLWLTGWQWCRPYSHICEHFPIATCSTWFRACSLLKHSSNGL